ncbi:MAG: DUF3634 family protein [Myxococcales bacterium]|nr:DUF3634 family protein [Myxococcales bacterium]
MSTLVGLLILVLLGLPLWVAISRSNELFCLQVRGGKARVVRGRLPQRLLDELGDVLGRPPLRSARIRVVVEDRAARVVVDQGSVPPDQLQQLRNVVGTFPVAAIRAGGRAR